MTRQDDRRKVSMPTFTKQLETSRSNLARNKLQISHDMAYKRDIQTSREHLRQESSRDMLTIHENFDQGVHMSSSQTHMMGFPQINRRGRNVGSRGGALASMQSLANSSQQDFFF